VCSHDFPDTELGKVTPYGVYDLTANTGWVNVGTDHDTAAFAVESLRRWWYGQGQGAYPHARRLLITADAGGSNGYRTRAWKAALAVQTGLEITVCHFPPGTSKWNRIEHRLFCHITHNWRCGGSSRVSSLAAGAGQRMEAAAEEPAAGKRLRSISGRWLNMIIKGRGSYEPLQSRAEGMSSPPRSNPGRPRWQDRYRGLRRYPPRGLHPAQSE
jgi:hypothetical protein